MTFRTSLRTPFDIILGLIIPVYKFTTSCNLLIPTLCLNIVCIYDSIYTLCLLWLSDSSQHNHYSYSFFYKQIKKPWSQRRIYCFGSRIGTVCREIFDRLFFRIQGLSTTSAELRLIFKRISAIRSVNSGNLFRSSYGALILLSLISTLMVMFIKREQYILVDYTEQIIHTTFPEDQNSLDKN